MSYILDALRKADQDRNIGEVPDLETSHWARRHDGRVRHWIWIAAVLLIMNGVLLAVLFDRGAGTDSQSVLSDHQPDQLAVKPRATPSLSVQETVTPAEKTEEAPLVLLERNVIMNPRKLLRPPVEQPQTMKSGINKSTTDKLEVEKEITKKTVITKPQAEKSVSEQATQQPDVEKVIARKTPLEKPILSKVPETIASSAGSTPAEPSSATGVSVAKPVPVKAREPEIPGWDELSLEFRSGFNPPRLDVHVYADDPARRFILVGLTKFYEGDELDGGVMLEKILPDGIQLNYQGTRFIYYR